jgi:hypothetical protein
MILGMMIFLHPFVFIVHKHFEGLLIVFSISSESLSTFYALSFYFIVTFLEKQAMCSGLGLHLSMCVAAC